MKKSFPVILLILCICLVVGGLIGAMGSKSTASSAASGDSTAKNAVPAAAPRGGSFSGECLLDVRIPDSIAGERKDYTGFTLSFNKENRTPNWVAWELLGSEATGEVGRYNKFWQDTDLEGCPTTRDYSNSGYDRGHMCPAADQKWSQEAMVDCFSLANIVPQANALNTGAWKTLENKERQWAQRDSAIIIIAGPIYEKSDTPAYRRGPACVCPAPFSKCSPLLISANRAA